MSWLIRTLLLPLKLLFGFDTFVSYSREDGLAYAEALSAELGRATSVRIDLQETRPGLVLPLSLRLSIALSKVLVIVTTPRAAGSIHVEKEVATFERWSRGPVIPIELGCPVEKAVWWHYIAGVARAKEIESGGATLAPSEAVLARVRNSVGFWRLSRRQALVSTLFAIVFALLSFFSYRAGALRNEAMNAANRATNEASQQQQAARKAQGEASTQRAAAAAATKEAEARRLEAQQSLLETYHARIATQLEHDGAEALKLFGTNQIAGLLAAMRSARRLEALTGASASFVSDFDRFRALSPVTALVRAVTQIRQRHEWPMVSKDDSVEGIRFSGDGRVMAARNGGDDMVRVWDVASSRALATLKTDWRGIEDFDLSPDGETVATCGQNHVKLWDARTGRLLAVPSTQEGFCTGIRFSPDGRFVGAGLGNGTTIVWDVPLRREGVNVKGGHLAFSPDGSLVATAGAPSVWLWDTATGGQRYRLDAGDKSITVMRFSPDGRTLATGGLDGAKLWTVAVGNQLTTVSSPSPVVDLAFSADGTMLATLDSDHALRLWRVPDGGAIVTLPGQSGGFTFDPMDGSVITGDNEGRARYWNQSNWREKYQWQSHENWFRIASSPNRGTFASGGDDGIVKLWQIATPSVALTLDESLVAFSANGETLLADTKEANTKDRVRVLRRVRTGKAIRSWPRNADASFSPDGRFVSAGDYLEPGRFWDATTGREVTATRRVVAAFEDDRERESDLTQTPSTTLSG